MVAKKKGPEIKSIAATDSHMDLILYLADSPEKGIHIFFRRPREEAISRPKLNEAYVTFYNPRHGTPKRLAKNHFRMVAMKRSIYQHIVALLKVIEYEFQDRDVTIHFGWPLSSWIDRLSIGVMVFNIMRLPKMFSSFSFNINYPGRTFKLFRK
ncbi:MAG: hypothetical protein ACP5U1_10140 [Desulfomonilaceae bacterium]